MPPSIYRKLYILRPLMHISSTIYIANLTINRVLRRIYLIQYTRFRFFADFRPLFKSRRFIIYIRKIIASPAGIQITNIIRRKLITTALKLIFRYIWRILSLLRTLFEIPALTKIITV